MDVANNCVQSLFRDGVVPTRPHLRRESVVQHHLASDLGSHRDAEHHPCELKSIPEDVEVSHGKDERDNGAVGNRRGSWKKEKKKNRRVSNRVGAFSGGRRRVLGVLTRVVPRQQLREEGVVVRQLLARGGAVRRGLAGGGEGGQLAGCLCVLVPNILGKRACVGGKWLVSRGCDDPVCRRESVHLESSSS